MLIKQWAEILAAMFSSAQSLNHHSDYRTAINQLRSHPHHFFKSPAKRRLSHQHLEHHHASGAERVFVQVAYDFDYVGEDGGQVVMRENEILLLINKTNHDWWQVRTSSVSNKKSDYYSITLDKKKTPFFGIWRIFFIELKTVSN